MFETAGLQQTDYRRTLRRLAPEPTQHLCGLAGFWVEIAGAKVAGGGLVFNAQEWITIKNGSMVMASSIFKLPLDGSKTGAWGEFTGAAGSVTLAAGTLTGLTRALTSATRTLTAGSVAATVSAGSTTFTKTSI